MIKYQRHVPINDTEVQKQRKKITTDWGLEVFRESFLEEVKLRVGPKGNVWIGRKQEDGLSRQGHIMNKSLECEEQRGDQSLAKDLL